MDLIAQLKQTVVNSPLYKIQDLRCYIPQKQPQLTQKAMRELLGQHDSSLLHIPMLLFFKKNKISDTAEFQKIILSVINEQLKDSKKNFALGSMIGLFLGDSIGAPVEFIPVEFGIDKIVAVKGCDIVYKEQSNKFGLFPGQWTDDSSMASCLMDSLICHSEYNGSDLRARFFMWWNFGYNNAFRFDNKHSGSIGLGGNISDSLNELYETPIVANIPPTRRNKQRFW